MTYINLTRAEIELLAHCRSLTLWDASGEHTLDEGSSAWNGLVGAACDSADLLGVIREQRAEIERLTRELADTSAALETEKQCVARYLREHMTLRHGIHELDNIHRHERAYTALDPHDGRWYVYVKAECNDDRHADSLLELLRKLGASADDIGQTPDDA